MNIIDIIGISIIIFIFIFTYIIRVIIQNAKVTFLNNEIIVTPPQGNLFVPITVSGYVQSTTLLPSTTVNIMIKNINTLKSAIVFDPTFPINIPGGCVCVPINIVFVPVDVDAGNVFTNSGEYLIEARVYSNGYIFASTIATFMLL